jgi:ketosteroid isomerase-like protein
MSEENVEMVRRGLEDFVVTGELAPDVADDVVWDMSTFQGWPDEPLFHGWEGFYEFFAAWREPHEDWSLILDDILDAGGENVVALLTQKGKPHGSDSDVHLEFGVLYTIRDGVIRQMQVYSAKQDALEAAGLVG